MVLSISFVLYVLVERPGMRFSERLRQKMLKVQTPPVEPAQIVNVPSPVNVFDPEKTDPRPDRELLR